MPNYNTLWEERDLVGVRGSEARIRGGGGGGGLDPIEKSRYMGRSRSKPPPALDEISWFLAWGGGGGAIYFPGMH